MSSPIIAGILMDFPFGYFSYMFGIRGSLLIGLLIITYLEAAIFHLFRGGSWRQAVSDSFWINIASSVLGYMTTFAVNSMNYGRNGNYFDTRPDLYGSDVDWTQWMLFDENLVPGVPSAVIFLLLSFLISILCEGLLYERLAKPLPRDDSWSLVVIANGASYALLFSVYLWWQLLPVLYGFTFVMIRLWPLTLMLLIWLVPGLSGMLWRGIHSGLWVSVATGLAWVVVLIYRITPLAGSGWFYSWVVALPLRLSLLVMKTASPNSYSRYPPAILVLFFSLALALLPLSCWRTYQRYRRRLVAGGAVKGQKESPDQAVPLKEPPATAPLP